MEEEKKGQVGSGENVYAILAYLWILCLIPILMKKEDEFVKFHAKQGLMLFIVEIAIGIIGIIPVIGQFIATIGMIACGVLSIIAIVQVLMGNKWKMPVISDWAEKIKV